MRKKPFGVMRGRLGFLWCMAVLLSATFPAKAILAGQELVSCPPLAGVQGVDKCSLGEAHPTEICKLLTNKTATEKAQIKSREIARQDFKGEYTNTQYGVRVEIIGEVKEININGQSGIELFAKAWRDDKQLGFGKDGSVEIERFRIFNPPILIDDSNGDIVREWTDSETGELKQRKLRESPREAIRQSLAHTITIVGKENNNITVGKVGNTTSTFYPDAGDPGSTSVDGYVQRVSDCSTWSNVRDSGGTAAYAAGTSFSVGLNAAYCSGTWYIMSRAITLFNTSAIGSTSTITSATYSLWNLTKRDELIPSGAMSVVTTNPASNTTLAASDYSQTGDILQAPIITLANITTSAYNDFALNSTGLSNISKTGVTKFGMRLDADRTNTEPTYCNCNSDASFSSADTTGTTQDPKLVVVHSAPTLIDNLVSYWKLDESSANAADSVGYNTLVNQGSMTYATGKIYNCAKTETTGSKYLKITNASQTGLNITGDITVSLWLKTTDNGKYVLQFTDGSTGVGYGIALGTAANIPIGKAAFFIGQSWFTTTSSTRVDDGNWHHIVMTMSGTSVALYFDGSVDGTGTASAGLSYTGDRSIGDRGASVGNYNVDEVGVWSRALSSSEITQLYNSGAGLQYPFVSTSDTTAPSGSISINSGASYTNSSTVTLTLSATDATGVTGYYLSDSSSTPSASASGWTSVTSTTSYSATVSYSLSGGEGGKTLYVWYKDAAGNVSSTASATITLDTTVPTVTISSPTSSSTYTSTSSTISLGGSASDSSSGISTVTWSNDRGGNGTATGTASWTVSSISLSSGDNVITVTAKDGANNSGTDTLQVTYSTNTSSTTTSTTTTTTSSTTTTTAPTATTSTTSTTTTQPTTTTSSSTTTTQPGSSTTSTTSSTTTTTSSTTTTTLPQPPTPNPTITPRSSPSPAPTLPPLPTLQPSPSPVNKGIVFGFVNDEDEQALESVTVTIVGANGSSPYQASTETDENGYYEFSGLEVGNYSVTYQKDGYETQTQDISLEAGELKDLDTVTMEQSVSGKIYGYALNIKGEPIEYVRLKLKGIKTKVTENASTDADGFFEFADLDADTYLIIAKKKGYRKNQQKVKLEDGASEEIEIVMKKTSKRIKGLLLEEDVQ